MKLSKRLNTLIQLVRPTRCLADVGCDHGLLAIHVYLAKKAQQVLAIDNKPGPLSRCQQIVNQYALQQQIDCILSDGLKKIATPIDTIVIAGMGGEMMISILQQDLEKVKSCQQILLQPHSKLFELKRYLYEQGFLIVSHSLLEEEKVYVILDVIYQGNIDFEEIEIYRMNSVNDQKLYRKWLQQAILARKNIPNYQQDVVYQKLSRVNAQVESAETGQGYPNEVL